MRRRTLFRLFIPVATPREGSAQSLCCLFTILYLLLQYICVLNRLKITSLTDSRPNFDLITCTKLVECHFQLDLRSPTFASVRQAPTLLGGRRCFVC